MERVERLLLELAHAFGTDPGVGAEAARHLHRPVELAPAPVLAGLERPEIGWATWWASKQPTCLHVCHNRLHVWHNRRWTNGEPIRRHSSYPSGVGRTTDGSRSGADRASVSLERVREELDVLGDGFIYFTAERVATGTPSGPG